MGIYIKLKIVCYFYILLNLSDDLNLFEPHIIHCVSSQTSTIQLFPKKQNKSTLFLAAYNPEHSIKG